MKSMTGYGTASGKVGLGRLYVEIKTINHRYCDLSFKIPFRMGGVESSLREILQAQLERGRIEIFMKEAEPIFGVPQLHLNLELARQYDRVMKRLARDLHWKDANNWLSAVGVGTLVQVKEPEGDYTRHWSQVKKLVAKALQQVERMRRREGEFILRDQKKRLQSLLGFIEKTEHRRLAHKNHPSADPALTNNGANDISEEITRLKSHAEQYEKLLSLKGPVGRKLDFLIQEMHREVNTLGAKAGDATISKYIVECKALLENLREQIQNVI